MRARCAGCGLHLPEHDQALAQVDDLTRRLALAEDRAETHRRERDEALARLPHGGYGGVDGREPQTIETRPVSLTPSGSQPVADPVRWRGWRR